RLAVTVVHLDGLQEMPERGAVAFQVVVDEAEKVVRFGAGSSRERALELRERALPIVFGGGEATERAVRRERRAAARNRVFEKLARAFGLALVAEGYAEQQTHARVFGFGLQSVRE